MVFAAKYFYHREFSFTIDETYIRYQSFRNESELKRKLKSMCPHKIDIGAVYTLPVRSRARAPSLCAVSRLACLAGGATCIHQEGGVSHS